jgi:hypothetical protein
MFFPRIWPYCPYFNQILHLKGQTATLVSIQHMLPQARGFLELLYDVPDQTKSYLWRLTPGILQHFLHTKSYTDSHYSVLTAILIVMNPTLQNGKLACNHWTYGTSYASDILHVYSRVFVNEQFRTQVYGPDAGETDGKCVGPGGVGVHGRSTSYRCSTWCRVDLLVETVCC